ncbi:cue domain containing protein [Anaeramoeba ignava]|uniref:Cue domain containing protein n=1 Tax=Anaeramoeba ignava TaxID=1746090 RepID=A0A9Q0LFD8_ANAIG|nr:cue domain containing protein [Anaeramoeba ignava]
MSQTISLKEALTTLKEMFPDFQEEILIQVIRKNQGRLERTITELLTLDPKNPQVKPARQVQSQPRQQMMQGVYPQGVYGVPQQYYMQPMQPQPRFRRSLLPPGFLQYDDDAGVTSRPRSKEEMKQIQKDSQLAQMLANREFLNTLQGDAEFREMLGNDIMRREKRAEKSKKEKEKKEKAKQKEKEKKEKQEAKKTVKKKTTRKPSRKERTRKSRLCQMIRRIAQKTICLRTWTKPLSKLT